MFSWFSYKQHFISGGMFMISLVTKKTLKKSMLRISLSLSLLCLIGVNSNAENRKYNNGTFDYWLVDENNSTLTSSDLYNSIVIINGDNITVNLENMNSPISKSCIGIYIEGKSNVTINSVSGTRCYIQNFNTAVYILNSDHINLFNISCYQNNYGFRIENSYACNVNYSCYSSNNYYDGYLLINSQAIELDYQTPSGNGRYGILDLGCIGTTSYICSASRNKADGGYFGNSIAAYITKFVSAYNTYNGLTLNDGTHSCQVKGKSSYEKTVLNSNTRVGLCIVNSNGNTFTDCSGAGNQVNLFNNGSNNLFVRCSF